MVRAKPNTTIQLDHFPTTHLCYGLRREGSVGLHAMVLQGLRYERFTLATPTLVGGTKITKYVDFGMKPTHTLIRAQTLIWDVSREPLHRRQNAGLGTNVGRRYEGDLMRNAYA